MERNHSTIPLYTRVSMPGPEGTVTTHETYWIDCKKYKGCGQ
jgi:hypothetical protein